MRQKDLQEASEDMSGLRNCRQPLKEVGDRLRDAEQQCARIAEFQEPQADEIRGQLAEARFEFSKLRVELLRELDVVAMSESRAEQVHTAVGRDYLHPTAANAQTILRLIGTLLKSTAKAATPKSGSVGESARLPLAKAAPPGDSDRKSLGRRRGKTNLAIVQRRAIIGQMSSESARDICRALDEQKIVTPPSWAGGWESTYLGAERNRVEKLISNDKRRARTPS